MTERIEVVASGAWSHGSFVLVRVGDADIYIFATQQGRRCYVTIEEGGETSVEMSAHIRGREAP